MEGGNIFEPIIPPQQPLEPLRPRTLGEYSRPSHQGYRNTIELTGANVTPLRSDTIRLVQSGCAFHGLRSEDPNQHLRDFLKIVDSIDLDVATRETTRLRLFQFSLRDQASQWLARFPAGSITTWDDLTTRFLAMYFPPEKTAMLRRDIVMFEQQQGETFYEAWARFKDLLHKVPHHGINIWLLVQIFYDHVDFHTKRTIDRAAGGKLRDKKAEESWAIIEELATNNHEMWEFNHTIKAAINAISTSGGTTEIPNELLCKIEAKADYFEERQRRPLSPRRATINSVSKPTSAPLSESPSRENAETFQNYAPPYSPPKELSSEFEARMREYMATHSARLARFEEAVYKQKEEMQEKMNEMMSLLEEYANQKTPERILLRKESTTPTTQFVNSITIIHKDSEKVETPTKQTLEEPSKSQPLSYYLKHEINESTITNWIKGDRHNQPPKQGTEKEEEGEAEEYNTLPGGPIFEKLLVQKVATKQVAYGNFEIPTSIGDLKYLNAFADQGSEVNLMPLTIYTQLTLKMPAPTRVRLSLAGHSYVYPLGIAEDVLVNVTGFMYPVDFMIIDDKGGGCMPIILGAPFLATARAVIKYEGRKIELKSGKRKVSFPMTPRSGHENLSWRRLESNIDTTPVRVQNKILAWEARIKSYKEAKYEGNKDDKANVKPEHNQPTLNHTPFEEGNSVLLRHFEITIPPDKPRPWWYGPFTIESIHQDGKATIKSRFGGEVIASIDRLRYYHYSSNDHKYMGYIILRDEVT